MVSGTAFSFYKQDPNLMVPNSGLLLMREKKTLEVIAQMGRAGKLSLVMQDRAS